MILINHIQKEKIDFNTKITEIQNEIPDITSVATNTMLDAKVTEIKNKISDTNSLVKKTDFYKKGNRY